MRQDEAWYSPWSKVVELGGERQRLWKVEARDMARGFCGALFLALPLLYTLEMWERARVIPSWDLALIVVLAYFVNVGFALFGNYKAEPERQNIWLDAVTAMGIGLVASAITLFLVGRYNLQTPPEIMIKVLLLEMVPSSFGASLAINQLGKRDDSSCDDDDAIIDRFNPDFRKILGTVLGGTMFAFNVAPTIEPKVITYGASWWHTLGILAFSLFVSWLMVFFASFCDPADSERGVLRGKGVETIASYLVSLVISGTLLWMFGYLNLNTSLEVAVPWIITLGYATTLGGSAGRLIL